MSSWFVQRNGQQLGPFTFAQLQELKLAPGEGVWQQGTPAWVSAASVPGLLAAPAPAPAPAPATGSRPGLKFHLARAMEWNLRAVAVKPEEEATLLSLGVDDPAARSYLAWRRSVLTIITLASGITSIIGILSGLAADTASLTELGKGLEMVRALALVIMPVTAWKAARAWTRHKRSRRWLVWGWTLSFLAPLLTALVPAAWQVTLGPEGEASQMAVVLQLIGAIGNYVTLMPTVLALIPGIMRACLRVKVLLPQSMLPGWFLVAASPLWVFLFLVVFAIFSQVTSDALLIVGVAAIAGGPVLYLFHVGLFTRPVAADDDLRRLLAVQKRVRLVLTGGVACVIVWLFSGTVFGKHVVGVEVESSLMRPWSFEMFKLPLEFASHSLFTMALVADLIMAMNLAIWVHTKGFLASPEAKDYDRTMSEIDEAGERD